MKGRASHAILEKGLQVLVNLDHRGATGADATLGDGCGVLTQIPHRFFAEECAKLGFALPEPGHYAIGQFFMPRDAEARARAEAIVAEAIAAEGCDLIGWRDIPVDNSDLGERVKAVEPAQRQVFIGRRAAIADEETFERRLFILRKVISNRVYAIGGDGIAEYYPVSMSCRTIVYKGMVLVRQLRALLPGPPRRALRERARHGPLALLHQHVPVLGARPPLPHHRPQRRDQHPARQRQLDAGPPVAVQFRSCSATTSPSCGRSPTKASPTPPASTTRSSSWWRRLLARPRDDDADPRGLGRQPADGRGAARLLRVPRRGDGAVGRPAGDGLHRRPDRRHARPQRPGRRATSSPTTGCSARLRNGRAAERRRRRCITKSRPAGRARDPPPSISSRATSSPTTMD